MKKLFFFFFLCLFVGLESGICQEKDIPDWFLTPSSGEYVGVSLPLEQADQRENSALTAALLSYFAIHPGEVKEHENALVNASETVYDNGKSLRSKSVMKGMFEEAAQERFTRTLTQRIDYRIVRRFVNARGELFIAIQVKESGDTVKVETRYLFVDSTESGISFKEASFRDRHPEIFGKKKN